MCLLLLLRLLQVIVAAVIESLPMLGDVALLAAFYFIIFGIACVELFRGRLAYRCGTPDFSSAELIDDTLYNVSYTVDPSNTDQQSALICKGPLAYDGMWSNATGKPVTNFSYVGGRQWGYACPWWPSSNPNDLNNPRGAVCFQWGNPDIGGYRSFDHIFIAWFQVFQHVAVQVGGAGTCASALASGRQL